MSLVFFPSPQWGGDEHHIPRVPASKKALDEGHLLYHKPEIISSQSLRRHRVILRQDI